MGVGVLIALTLQPHASKSVAQLSPIPIAPEYSEESTTKPVAAIDPVDLPPPLPEPEATPAKEVLLPASPTPQAPSSPAEAPASPPPAAAAINPPASTRPVGQTLFELTSGVMVQKSNRSFGIGSPDLVVSINYRVHALPDETIRINDYRLVLEIDKKTTTVGFGELWREGTVQEAFSIFGFGVNPFEGPKVSAPIRAWVESGHIGDGSTARQRESNILTLSLADRVPDPLPPPVNDGRSSPLKIDRSVPPEVQARIDEQKRKFAERDKPLSEESTNKILEGLRSNNKFEIKRALIELAHTHPNERREEMNKALTKVFRKADEGDRRLILEAWAKWGTETESSFMIAALEEEDGFMQRSAIEGLGHVGTPKAIEALCTAMRQTRNYNEVEKALIEIGAPAEDEAIKLLESDNADTVKHTLRVLSEIGGPKALAAMNKLRPRDTFLKMDLERAVEKLSASVRYGQSDEKE